MFWAHWNTVDRLIVGSTFALVLALWVMGLVAWQLRRSRTDRPLRRRLGTAPALEGARELRLWREGREVITHVPDRPASATLRVRLERLLASAGLEVPFETVLIWGVSATAGVALFALTMTRSLWGALGALVVLALSVQMYLDRRVTKQTEKFERQLIAAMDLAARSLRAGHPLLSSFRLISDEIAAPVGTIFARVCQQQAMGMSLEQALRQVAEESGSPDLKVFATSVVIQMRSGANLADMMERLTMVIRDRMRLAAHIRVLTAQTRFSKRVLLAVPIGLFVLVNFINPEYMRPLYESDLGKVLLGIGVGGMLLGAWLMRHMAKLRY